MTRPGAACVSAITAISAPTSVSVAKPTLRLTHDDNAVHTAQGSLLAAVSTLKPPAGPASISRQA
jgi:hypothetical protein